MGAWASASELHRGTGSSYLVGGNLIGPPSPVELLKYKDYSNANRFNDNVAVRGCNVEIGPACSLSLTLSVFLFGFGNYH